MPCSKSALSLNSLNFFLCWLRLSPNRRWPYARGRSPTCLCERFCTSSRKIAKPGLVRKWKHHPCGLRGRRSDPGYESEGDSLSACRLVLIAGLAIGDDFGPGAHAAGSGDAVVVERPLQHDREECTRMVPSSLWTISRVAGAEKPVWRAPSPNVSTKRRHSGDGSSGSCGCVITGWRGFGERRPCGCRQAIVSNRFLIWGRPGHRDRTLTDQRRKPSAPHARSAAISGLMPTMFMTRVRL